MNIPAELRALNNFVVWKYETKDGSNELTKIPYDAKTKCRAKANDPTTWASYEEATDAADVLKGDFEGIGFELLGTEFIGTDFDGVVHDGEPEPYVLDILKQLGNPYCEISPSGNGMRAIVRCTAPLPPGRKFGEKRDAKKYGAEIYSGGEAGRYLTITENYFSGSGIPTLENADLPHFLISQIRNEKFKKLWMGDGSDIPEGKDNSQSGVDLALLKILANCFNNDAEKMDKVFRASINGKREKWTLETSHSQAYRQNTIKKALNPKIAGDYPRAGESHAPKELVFHSPAVVDSADKEYVIAPTPDQEDGWFPFGDISLVGGASGTGKTTLIFEMLNKQRQKFPFLDHRTFGYRFHVLAYDRGKGAFKRTLRRMKLLPTDVPITPLPLAFGIAAVQSIVNEIEKLNPLPDVIFVEGMDMLIDDANKKSVVSPFMRHLQNVAEHFHIALICSVGAPKSKRGEDYAAKRDKLSGSEAWGRNCETVAILEYSEEDDGTSPHRELTVIPRNAPAEKFSLQFERGRLVIVQPKTEEEKQQHAGRPDDGVQAAIEFLRTELQGKPDGVLVRTLLESARIDHNLARSTMYRAEKSLHLVKRGENQVRTWTLPLMHKGVEDGEEVTEEQMEFKSSPPTTPL